MKKHKIIYKIKDFLSDIFALIFAIVIVVIGLALQIGVPIAALFIVYCIAKYLFTGVW